MKYANVIVLVLVFLTAILLHWLLTTKEHFETTKTPLTRENVKATLDSFILDILANYQEYKKEFEKNKDPRIRYRIVDMGNFIVTLNDAYPQYEYMINNYPYASLTAISLEEIKLLTTFLTQRIGVYGAANSTSADLNDIDTFSSRIKSTMGMIEQKAALVQGSSGYMSMVRTETLKILENLLKLKKRYKNISNNDIPLLKSDQYWYALAAASSNFIMDRSLLTQEISELEVGNLPGSKPTTSIIKNIVTVPPTAPPTVPPTEPLPAPPTPTPLTTPPTTKEESMKFSELVKSLISYGPNGRATTDELLKIQYNTNGQTINSSNISGTLSSKNKEDHASIDDIKKVIRDEISQEFAALKLGPKDKVNDSLSSRSMDTITPDGCKTNSNALEQGSWFRTAAEEGCPYAQGQQPTTKPVIPIDMNDYIRKDSIPCWGCKLK
jgi:serine/threonine protein kinase